MDFDSIKIDCDIESVHPSVIDRYYQRKYKTDLCGVKGNDQCILLHSNRVCVVTVAPSHPVLADGKTVVKVDFQVGKDINRLDNKVIGKGKRGAQSLSKTAPLCHVTCSDDTVYTMCSCVKGHLVEVNENLVNHPQLITQKPETDGYIGIVLTTLNDHEREIEKLKSAEQYEQILKDRKENS